MPTTEPPRLPFGGIGPYRVLAEIGRGGMGVVYRAEDTRLNREVALKVLLPHLASDPAARERFLREARAQARVAHEHVLSVLEVNEVNGVAFIAFPLLKGRTLAAELAARAGPLPLKDALRVGRETAEGLAAAHSAGLVHRDIKPSNIWLDGDKRAVRVLDFGLARTTGDGVRDAGTQLTVAGALVGTPAYMSPEQANGAPADARSDLWSLGVVLYEAATGQKPFGGPNRSVVLYHVCESAPDDPLALAPHLPPALAALIVRLLSKNPDDRPQSAAAVAAVLSTIAAGPLPQVVPVRAPTAPELALETVANEPRPKRAKRKKKAKAEPNWVLIGIGGTFAFVLLIALAIGLSGGKKAEPERAAVPADPPKPSWEPLKPKPEPKPKLKTEPPKTEPPVAPPKVDPPVVPPKADPPQDDSAAARALNAHALLYLRLPDGSERTVPVRGALPPAPFVLEQVDFLFAGLPDKRFIETTFLPEIARLKSLTKIRMGQGQMALTAEHLRQMAEMPFAAKLAQIDAGVVLTEAALTELAKFPALTWLAVRAPDPNDALFVKLAGFDRLRGLRFYGRPNPPNATLTRKGWEAVAQMPLDYIGIDHWKGPLSTAFAALTAPGAQQTLMIGDCDLSDADLVALAKRPNDVRALHLYSLPRVTNTGVAAVAALNKLEAFTIGNCGTTPPGLIEFDRARRGVRKPEGQIQVLPRKPPESNP